MPHMRTSAATAGLRRRRRSGPSWSAVKSVYLKGRTMSKNRLLSVAAIVAVIATASVLATTTASAKPAKQNAPIKLGFITKFPVDFYFLLVNAAKKWDKATPGA